MRRNIDDVRGQTFDIVIVGGGAFAACAAWEAVLRGYSVALIEANDFGSGTSANSYKMVHGGIRYVQHLDLPRVWESCRERSALLRIAPHLVKPLPIAVPTYGHGRSGKEFLGAGFALYDLLTLGRNRGITDTTRQVPGVSMMSRAEVLDRFEGVAEEGLTGAAVFNDAQMYHPPRLVLSFLLSAAGKGACCLNYVKAISLLHSSKRVTGVRAQDRISGSEFEIRARVVLNAAGPWSEDLLAANGAPGISKGGVYSRDTCFVIDGAPETEYALAMQGRSVDKGSLLGREARHLFVVPWRGRRLIGVWHIVYRKGADRVRIDESEVERFLKEFNASAGGTKIRREDIRIFNAGLVPFGESDDTGQNLEFGKRSHIVDAGELKGPEGLVTLVGIRHTMARGDAAKAIRMIDGKLGRRGPEPDTTQEPIFGGGVRDVGQLIRDTRETLHGSDAEDLAVELTSLYGDTTPGLLDVASKGDGFKKIGGGGIIKAQIDAAIRDEMAQTLGDVVFRRTPLAAGGNPGGRVIELCADVIGQQLNWTRERRKREIESVLARFPTENDCGRISETDSEDLLDDTTFPFRGVG